MIMFTKETLKRKNHYFALAIKYLKQFEIETVVLFDMFVFVS